MKHCLFTIEGEADPQLPSRILGILTVRGTLPESFSMRRHGSECIHIAVNLTGLDEQSATQLSRRISNLPTVLEVSRSWRGCTGDAPVAMYS